MRTQRGNGAGSTRVVSRSLSRGSRPLSQLLGGLTRSWVVGVSVAAVSAFVRVASQAVRLREQFHSVSRWEAARYGQGI
jgi:hypothetical protein